jgi:hypothetical protein
MQPRAIEKDMAVRGPDGLLRVKRIGAGREYILDHFDEFILDLADGSRTVEEMADAAGCHLQRTVAREEVFSTLDFLADAGLIDRRASPPAPETGVSRRTLLTRLAPVISTAAWMATGMPGTAHAFQYQESSSKESNSKAEARESDSKESNRKADSRESDNKEYNRKANDRERDQQRYEQDQDKEHDRKGVLRDDIDNSALDIEQQQANRTGDRKRYFQQLIMLSWPKVYDVMGHTLSEFPEMASAWEAAKGIALRGKFVTPLNCDALLKNVETEFGWLIELSPEARTRFAKAGFDLPLALIDWGNNSAVLIGDSSGQSSAILEPVVDPAFGDNWRHAFDPNNVRLDFSDVEAAYRFLSKRR